MTEQVHDIAGEYVLGTLSHQERLDFEKRLKTDIELQHAVADWEQRLAPFNDDFSSLETKPRDEVWQTIEARLDGAQPEDETAASLNVITFDTMRKSRNRWRGLALAAMALAASFVGLQALGLMPAFLSPPSMTQNYVAVLTPQGEAPGFLIRVDVGQKRLFVQRIAGRAPTGKDYELWLVGADGAPQSLAVVGRERVKDVGYQTSGSQGSLSFAISLEPEGGSPTGKVTGPIVYSGRLLEE